MQHWKSWQYCICVRGGGGEVRERERQHPLKDCWDLDLKTRYYDARCATVPPAVHIIMCHVMEGKPYHRCLFNVGNNLKTTKGMLGEHTTSYNARKILERKMLKKKSLSLVLG